MPGTVAGVTVDLRPVWHCDLSSRLFSKPSSKLPNVQDTFNRQTKRVYIHPKIHLRPAFLMWLFVFVAQTGNTASIHEQLLRGWSVCYVHVLLLWPIFSFSKVSSTTFKVQYRHWHWTTSTVMSLSETWYEISSRFGVHCYKCDLSCWQSQVGQIFRIRPLGEPTCEIAKNCEATSNPVHSFLIDTVFVFLSACYNTSRIS